MKNITLNIDDKKITCLHGTSVLEAAKANGIHIPTLCHHPDLKPHGGCRLCLVEETKSGKLFASCVTPAANGMVLQTNSQRIHSHRLNIVRLMMAEHPESCILCSKGNRCRLRKTAGDLGLADPDLYPMPNYTPQDQSNPFISRDLSKCILCGKCIRACRELVSTGTFHYSLRGFKSRPETAHNLPLKDSSCTFCGTCVSMCPTGALAQTGSPYIGTPASSHNSICGFCGIGCSLTLGVSDNRVVKVTPSQKKGSVNGSTLCVRGTFAHDFLNTPERLTQPLIQENHESAPVSWDRAIETVSERLLSIKKKYGAESIGFMGSSKCTNEENYLFQKIARKQIGTHNIDNGGLRYGRNHMALLDELTGGRCRTNSLSVLEDSEAILVIGADPCQTVPVMGYHIKRAANKNTPVVVINFRHTELAGYASSWLRPGPEKADPVLYTHVMNSLSYSLLEKLKTDRQDTERFPENMSLFFDELQSLNLDNYIAKAGIDPKSIETAAELLSGKKTALVTGCDLFEHKNGDTAIHALSNLFRLTKGSLHLLSMENNLIGAWDMGTVPDALPGRRDLSDITALMEYGEAWGCELSKRPGLDMIEMIEAAEKKSLKALYIMGENPLRTLPQSQRVRQALENLELLVVQDIAANETTQLAHITLPGAPFSEKSGSFTNLEGRIQCFTPAVSPPGNAKNDFQILALLSSKMEGSSKMEESSKGPALKEIRDEISRLVPAYAGLANENDTTWLGQPDPAPGEPFHETDMPFSKPVIPEEEPQDDRFPVTAVIISKHYHAGSGTRTASSHRIIQSGLKGHIEVSESDFMALELEKNGKIRVVSQYGTITREIKINHHLSPGTILIPRAFNGNDVINLFPLSSPGSKDFQGWKRCRVTMEKTTE